MNVHYVHTYVHIHVATMNGCGNISANFIVDKARLCHSTDYRQHTRKHTCICIYIFSNVCKPNFAYK